MDLPIIETGKQVFIMNNNQIELFIVRRVHIQIVENGIGPAITYFLRHPNTKDKDATIQKYAADIFETKTQLINSL